MIADAGPKMGTLRAKLALRTKRIETTSNRRFMVFWKRQWKLRRRESHQRPDWRRCRAAPVRARRSDIRLRAEAWANSAAAMAAWIAAADCQDKPDSPQAVPRGSARRAGSSCGFWRGPARSSRRQPACEKAQRLEA